MSCFSNRTEDILRCYENHLELVDSLPIGFSGVASEVPAQITTDPVSDDILVFGFNVDFSVSDVLVSIQSQTPQYNWMVEGINTTPQLTPIGAMAGESAQVMPVLWLIQPFWLEENGVLRFQFQNSATAPVTGGIITVRGLKLTGKINGGWRGYRISQR